MAANATSCCSPAKPTNKGIGQLLIICRKRVKGMGSWRSSTTSKLRTTYLEKTTRLGAWTGIQLIYMANLLKRRRTFWKRVSNMLNLKGKLICTCMLAQPERKNLKQTRKANQPILFGDPTVSLEKETTPRIIFRRLSHAWSKSARNWDCNIPPSTTKAEFISI